VGHLFNGGGNLLQGFTTALGPRFHLTAARCWSPNRSCAPIFPSYVTP
jgi:hypothetical protein